MEEKITTDYIISQMHLMVEDKRPIAPSWWIDAAAKLNVLIGDDQDKLYELQSSLAKMKSAYIEEGKTSAAANALIEAEDEFLEMQKLKGKVKQVEEFIRISKIRAKMQDSDFQLK
jgi:hypothetical protein